MRKPVKIALAVLFVAVVGFAMWEGLRTKEPVYQGKPLRTWLDEYYLSSSPGDRPKRDAAMSAIGAIGTNGIPTLLSMVRADDSAMKSKLRGFWSRHFSRNPKLPFWLRYPRWVGREPRLLNGEAYSGFKVLGENAGQAVPALVEIFERSNSEEPRMATMLSILAIGPTASNALPSFLRAATNNNAAMRECAVLALAELKVAPQLVVPALVDALADPAWMVRAQGAGGLGRRGADGQPGVPMLLYLLQDTNAFVRDAAARALGQIEEAAAKAAVNTNVPGN